MSPLRCPRCGARYDPPARFCIRDGFPLVSDGPSPRNTPRPALHRTGEVPVASVRPGDPASGLTGRRLDGRFLLERRIGEGGMACVYRARDGERGGEVVAIKVLGARLKEDSEAMARLRREADLAMRLDHPNVCRIIALGEAGGLPYLVMPYLDGETLSKRECRNGPMPPSLAIPLLIQLARGLGHAHQAGVLHRDLKPENVMLVGGAEGERAVVMDFGLAKEALAGPEVTRLTQTGVVLGTPEFMSPEQIRGKPIDPRSDIFALGVLGFELVTGRLPFEGNTAQETMLAHLTGQPLRLRQVRGDLPEPLERVIATAIAHRPQDRYQSMQEFESALAAL